MSSYTIAMAAQLSGVPELRIRAWENRYGIISPERNGSKHRLFSDDDIKKLSLLKNLTDSGYRIGSLAGLSDEELAKMGEKILLSGASPEKRNGNGIQPNGQEAFLTECISALQQYDEKKLMFHLNEASIKYSLPVFIDTIILPFIERVGNYWREGMFRVSHEHFATTVLRRFLSALSDGNPSSENAPRIILATPEGQHHELGCYIARLIASSAGWQATYLGPNLPAEEIASVVRFFDAKVIAVSIVYPNDDPQLSSQLLRMRELLGSGVYIIAFGNAMNGYSKELLRIQAEISNSPTHFGEILREVRGRINMKRAVE